MKLLCIVALLSVFVPAAEAASSPIEQWRALGKGKGVVVAKIRTGGTASYVFFPATNAPRYSSVLAIAGVVFSRMEDAIVFAALKPRGIPLSFPSYDMVYDDAKILLEFPEAERQAIGAGLIGNPHRQ